jgi:hypothetical protein
MGANRRQGNTPKTMKYYNIGVLIVLEHPAHLRSIAASGLGLRQKWAGCSKLCFLKLVLPPSFW